MKWEPSYLSVLYLSFPNLCLMKGDSDAQVWEQGSAKGLPRFET